MSFKIILCQNCGAINKAKAEKTSLGVAYCGKCQTKLDISVRLLSPNVEKLDKIIKYAQLPVLIDAYADWCGPCKVYGPIFEEAAKRMWDKAEFYKLNTEKYPEFSARYNIRSIPTTLIFLKGSLVRSESGLLNQSRLESLVKQALQS